MFSYQIKRLFSKHLIALLIIAAAIALCKVLSVKVFYKEQVISKEAQVILDGYVKETLDMTAEKKFEYINEKAFETNNKVQQLNANGEQIDKATKAQLDAQSEYTSSLNWDVFVVLGVKEYANTGQGLVAPYVPSDFYYIKEAYTDVAEPDVINDHHFNLFITLQTYNIVSIFILLIVGLFVADSYEKRVDLQALISKNSKKFFISQEIVLSIFVGLLLILNLFTDLAVSGLLTHGYELSATLSSVRKYYLNPTGMTVFQTILLIFTIQSLGTYISYHIFRIAASALRSTKKYMIVALSLPVLSTLAARILPKYAIYFYTGLTNKSHLINSIKYIPEISATNIFIAIGIEAAILFGFGLFRFIKFKKAFK